MSAKLEKTRSPGIFKRGSRYVFSYRVAGRQRWESCRTLDEARKAKSARVTDIGRGEFEERSRVTLHEYSREWIERYTGRGRRGFRENTRAEYKRILERQVLRYFPERTKLTQITPSQVASFVAWLCDPAKQNGVTLSDSAVRNYAIPLRACLATAVREGLLRTNPARDIDLPHRPTVEAAGDEQVKALSRDELAALLDAIPDRYRLLFRLLASSGLRISEAIALRWSDLTIDSIPMQLRVRRARVKGTLGPPKSKHGRREIPLSHELAVALRRHREASECAGDDDLVFPSAAGTPLSPGNLRRRTLKPAAEAAGAPWAGLHTLRHTCASLLFDEGRNAVQVQRWMGHHSPSFTLSVYVHLLDGDIGKPLDLPQGVNKVQTSPTPLHTITTPSRAVNL